MGFAEEEVKKYIRNNYPMFHDIRLNQLLDFLPCLTQADREKIRCNTKNDGNVLSVSEFFEHLWCRKNWVTQLIDALKINKSDLAEVIEEVYRDAQLPSQRTQAVRSPPVAQCSRPPVSVPGDCSAPPSDDPPLSPPHDQPRPARGLFSTSSPQASLPDVVDFRSPVQETKFPSRSNETVSETEACDVKPKIAAPDPRNRNAAESEASLAAQHENPINPHATSPRSPARHQTPFRGVSEKEVQSSTPVSSRSDAGNLVRNWDGFQPRPVCVKNGYFGNASRSVGSDTSPVPELAVSSTPTASGNQPEENSYLSSDSSPLTPRGQDGAQAEEQKLLPLSGYQQDVLGNPVNQPFLRLRVGEKQEGAQGQQDSASNVSAVPSLPRVDFMEMPNDAIPTGSIPADLQRRGEALLPSVPSGTTTASCFVQDSSSVRSEDVPCDHSQCCEAIPSGGYLSKGNAVDLETRGPFVPENPQTAASLGRTPSKNSQLPQRSPRKEHFGPIPNTGPVGRFRSRPLDFIGPSSTDVIPPSSPAAVSDTLSDGYPEDFKPPIQERDLLGTDLWTASKKMIEDGPPGATAVRPSYVPNTPTNSRANGNNASGSSGGARVFFSNHGEEDISLEKPGALVSGVLSSPDGEYSGTSDKLCISSELSEDSDPLMLSGSNQVGRSEVSERSMLPGAKDDSLSRRNERHSDGGSIKTHVIQIKEPPSVNLSAAPEMTRLVLGNANQSLGDFSDFVAGDRPTKNASSLSVPTDGRRNSHQNKSVSDASWHMSESTLLAVGLTLTSLLAGAFVLYKQLKK